MALSHLLSLLRDALYAPPSDAAWAHLLDLLARHAPPLAPHDRALALAYAEDHLAAWPDLLRLWHIPRWDALDLHHPAWPLARTLILPLQDRPGPDAAPALARLLTPGALRHIRHLSLGQASLTPPALDALLDAPDLGPDNLHGGLQSLDLGALDLSDADLAHVLRAPATRALVQLDLGANRLSPEAGALLARAPRLARLRALALGHNDLRADGLRALTRAPDTWHLARLDLGRNAIASPGLRALVRSPQLRRIQHLCLGHNALHDDALGALAASPRAQTLEVLALGANRFSSLALAALARSPWLARLTHLDWGTAPLDHDAALALAFSPHLQRLVYLDTSVYGQDHSFGPDQAVVLAASPRLAPSIRRDFARASTPDALTRYARRMNLPQHRRLSHLWRRGQLSLDAYLDAIRHALQARALARDASAR